MKTHGHARRGAQTPEYRTWCNMRQRCENAQSSYYMNYGGRGIKVCKRWLKFENFLADMGERPAAYMTLDRKNNDGHYCKRNCRWASRAQQNNNRRPRRLGYRRSDALMLDGRHVSEWQAEWNVSYGTARMRVMRKLGRYK